MKLAKEIMYDFRGAGIPPTTGTAESGVFKKALTNGGTVSKNSDGMVLALSAVSEIQSVCVYNDDILAYHVDEIIGVDFLVKLTRTSVSMAATQVAFGLASARNATIDSITNAALFRAIGTLDCYLESDDGTTDVDDIDSGIDFLNGAWQAFSIDLAADVKTQAPPFVSKSGKSNIQFLAETGGSYSRLQQVGQGTAFSLEGVTGGLQLFAQIQKTAAVDQVSLTIRDIRVRIRDN